MDYFFVPLKLRGQGLAKKTMKLLCEHADKFKTNIELFPCPLDKQTDREKLLKFYRDFGFKRELFSHKYKRKFNRGRRIPKGNG